MINITLPDGVKKCIETLEKHGYKAYAVGGCVRDSLLGKTPKDYDVTTSALPEQVIACFDKTVPTGIKFGTVTVLMEDMSIEVTTFRSECQYDDYRRPSRIDFAADIKSDLSRRDFTVNAMAYSPQEGIIDLYNGQEHLKKGIICAVGQPEERFGEDALRIMRAFRFALRLGFEVDEDTMKAALSLSKNLSKISVERISSELTACLVTDNPADIKPLLDTGALDFVGIGKTRDNFERLNNVIKDKYARLCALILLTETELSGDICKGLRMDNNTVKAVSGMLKYCGNDTQLNDRQSVCAVLRAIGADLFDGLVSVRREVFCEDMSLSEQIKREVLQSGIAYRIDMLDIDGNTLFEQAGIPKGKLTGVILNELLKRVIDRPKLNNKAELITIAKNIYEQSAKKAITK